VAYSSGAKTKTTTLRGLERAIVVHSTDYLREQNAQLSALPSPLAAPIIWINILHSLPRRFLAELAQSFRRV
jgi:hypothetical protein